MMKIKTQQWLCIIAVMYWAPLSIAYYHSDYVHTHQKILLASNIPTRATAKATQEKEFLADSSNSTHPFYAADSTNSQFAGKPLTLLDQPDRRQSILQVLTRIFVIIIPKARLPIT